MRTMAALVRREFWEHRVFLWLPLALCVLFLLMCIVLGANFRLDSAWSSGVRRGVSPSAPDFFMVMTVALPAMISSIMAVVTFFYLSDSLYADRRDRSILFWKSLPVADSTTVLSKMLVALIVVPLLVYALALVTNLLAMLVFKVSSGTQMFSESQGIGRWLGVNGQLLLRIFVLALWYAPIVSYQLLISVSVPRMPVVWTLVPPLVLVFAERMFFGTWNVGLFVLERLSAPNVAENRNLVFGFSGFRDGLEAVPALSSLGLWAGVAVAAALGYAAILVRRHRSDA